jgi:hypothetical protein
MGVKDSKKLEDTNAQPDQQEMAQELASDAQQEAPPTPDQLAPTPPAAQPLAETPAPAAAPAAAPAQPTWDETATQAAPQTPAQAPAQMQQVSAPAAPARPPGPPTAAEYDAHDAQLQNDLATNRIQPKTMHDLFADKGVLGKIGTLFGLLIGGAGAGLTHGPNVVLEMMNKEIDRDLQAQKDEAGKKQTFLSTNYQHELQVAQAKHMAYENLLAASQVEMMPTEVALKKAQIEALPGQTALNYAHANALNAQNAGLAEFNRAKNAALITAMNDLQGKFGKDPASQGPLALVGDAINGQIKDNNAKAAAAQQINTAKQQTNNTQPVDMKNLQKMINVGKFAPEMPGAIPPADVPAITKEVAETQENRNFAKIFDDSWKKLDKMYLAGAINKNARAAQVATLGAAIARSTTGRYNTQEAIAQADGMFPSATDWGGARKEKYRKAMQFFEGNEAATPTLDRYGLKNPFPHYSLDGATGKTAVAESTAPVERITKNGQVALFDPKTKKFLRYKDQGNSALAGDNANE